MYSVLFICRQNRYRSPIAAATLRLYLKGDPSEQEWLIGSAGTWTQDGQPAMPGAVAEMSARGIDLSQHRSQQVSREMVKSYHLILTMDQNQKEGISMEFSDAANKIHLLSEMVGERWEVKDMDALAMVPYKQVADEIDLLIQRGLERIKKLAGEDC